MVYLNSLKLLNCRLEIDMIDTLTVQTFGNKKFKQWIDEDFPAVFETIQFEGFP
jgi:hypothetical protein